MEALKEQIKKIELAEGKIQKLKNIKSHLKAEHLHPSICVNNGGSLFDGVVVDNDSFVALIDSEIERTQESIREDKSFIAAIGQLAKGAK